VDDHPFELPEPGVLQRLVPPSAENRRQGARGVDVVQLGRDASPPLFGAVDWKPRVGDHVGLQRVDRRKGPPELPRVGGGHLIPAQDPPEGFGEDERPAPGGGVGEACGAHDVEGQVASAELVEEKGGERGLGLDERRGV
jgi:hypothetical protein